MKNQSITNYASTSSPKYSEKPKSKAIEVPSISLPKGGGAIKGIDGWKDIGYDTAVNLFLKNSMSENIQKEHTENPKIE